MDGDVKADGQACWRHYLRGKQYTRLPIVWHNDLGPDKAQVTRYAHQTKIIPYLVAREVILCAWTNVLSLFTGLDVILFQVILNDGSPRLSDRAISLPFCNSHSPSNDFAHSVQSVTDSLRKIQTYQRLILEQSELTEISTSLCGRCHIFLEIVTSTGEHDAERVDEDDLGKVPVKILFQLSESSMKVDIAFLLDQYRHQYIAEVLRQTLISIDKLSGQCLPSRDEVNLDLVLSWTQPCDPVPDVSLLQVGVERQSRLCPTKIAIGESERVMTYQELNTGADLLANSLWPDSPKLKGSRNIGIYFEKSAFAIMAMLAVLKTGRTYVPLDVAWPQQRVATVIDNAQISMVICSQMQSLRLPDQSIQIAVVDEKSVYNLKKTMNNQHRVWPRVDPSTPAYILYTSGSTGTPKGIPVSHSAICTSISAMARQFKTGPKTRTFQYTTFTFDLSIADLWMTLCYGGRICLPTEDERLYPGSFIAQERCNYAMITPTAASTISTDDIHENINTLALIGEAVPEQLLRRISTSDGSLKLYNTWGPTEASVIASSSKGIVLAADSSPSLNANNVGHPIGCSIFIVCVDDPRRLAPAFTPGEIALVGHTLADGYYGDPARTEQAFRTDLPWTKNKAVLDKIGDVAALRKVYLTGDIGRYNTNGDGSIIFMHRKEGGYIKVNGYRIDPGEVESKLSEQGQDSPFKDGVCVLAHDQPGGETKEVRQMLVCFFVASIGHEISELDPATKTAIKGVLDQSRQAMPEYMIPQLFVPVKSMPVLTSHKVDRGSLLRMIADSSWQDLVAKYGC